MIALYFKVILFNIQLFLQTHVNFFKLTLIETISPIHLMHFDTSQVLSSLTYVPLPHDPLSFSLILSTDFIF